MKNLGVGACGWDHESWVGEFYDADLPEDWRFQHYCNQFRTVLVPARFRVNLGSEEIDALADESDDGFGFVFGISASGLHEAPSLREENLASLRTRIDAWLIEITSDDRALLESPDWSESMRVLAGNQPVCLDYPGSDAKMGDLVARVAEATGTSVAWRPNLMNTPVDSGHYLVAYPVLGSDLQAQRAVAEILIAWMGAKRDAGMYFAAGPDTPERMRQCRILVELMGG